MHFFFACPMPTYDSAHIRRAGRIDPELTNERPGATLMNYVDPPASEDVWGGEYIWGIRINTLIARVLNSELL